MLQSRIRVACTRLRPDAIIPAAAHANDAGLDLYAVEKLTIEPGERRLVGTGIAIGLLGGLVGLVCPRSGLAYKRKVTVLNAPGIIDSDYRGEIKVNLINHGNEDFVIWPSDRIAQLVIVEHASVDLVEVEDLDQTERGTNGFGSTGA
jgi:dUTP pyrophosphatase